MMSKCTDLEIEFAGDVLALRQRIAELEAENAALRTRGSHSPDCDSLDINPDGITKPCNCVSSHVAALEAEMQKLHQEIKSYWAILSDEKGMRDYPAFAIEHLLDLYHTSDSADHKRHAQEQSTKARLWEKVKKSVWLAHPFYWKLTVCGHSGDTLEQAVERLEE